MGRRSVNKGTLLCYLLSITDYIITQVILTFSLVTYDLLEVRRTFDVIITKFFPLCFKMAESFKQLSYFLSPGERFGTKRFCRGMEQVREELRRKQKLFSF